MKSTPVSLDGTARSADSTKLESGARMDGIEPGSASDRLIDAEFHDWTDSPGTRMFERPVAWSALTAPAAMISNWPVADGESVISPDRLTSPASEERERLDAESDQAGANGVRLVSARRSHGWSQAVDDADPVSRSWVSCQARSMDCAWFCPGRVTAFLIVTSPPSERAFTSLSGEMVEKYVLYQKRLLSP